MKTCGYCLRPAVLTKHGEDQCQRDVAGFPGYRVSCDGQVWSCWNSRWGMSARWHVLKPKLSKKGPPHYQYVSLARDKRNVNQYVHLLVLRTFVGPCPAGMEGCHGDGNSMNNALRNLRWDSIVNNRADSISHGTLARGEDFPQAKLTDEKVRELRARRAAGESPSGLAREFGLHKRNVQRALSGSTWKHVA